MDNTTDAVVRSHAERSRRNFAAGVASTVNPVPLPLTTGGGVQGAPEPLAEPMPPGGAPYRAEAVEFASGAEDAVAHLKGVSAMRTHSAVNSHSCSLAAPST
jgi:hypothetical protein